MSGVEAVVHDASLTEIFKNISLKKNVEVEVKVVILLYLFNVEFSPYFLRSRILFRRYSFFKK